MSELDKKYNIIDDVTPPNVPLSAKYKQSFAYYTIQERLPIILTKLIDQLTRERDDLATQYEGERTQEDVKHIIANISQLKYEMQTNKEFTVLTGDETDKETWNTFLNGLPADEQSYFSGRWLYAECYMYRRLKSIFEQTETLTTYDYFAGQKENALITAYEIGTMVLKHANEFYNQTNSTATDVEQFFIKLLKINLWGNRCDLSISAGRAIQHNGNPFTALESFETDLLVNKCNEIWSCINAGEPSNNVIDIVLDNCGYEFFTDLVLADFLVRQQLAKCVRFHVKAIPWFISDVRLDDFHWTIKMLRDNANELIGNLGERLVQYLANDQIQLHDVDYFWTGPYEFQQMESINPELYGKLCTSHLVIFKGDLNYRKLLADLNTPFNATFIDVLRNFRPTNVCALRTIKADLICELADGLNDELSRLDPMWMETGKYGLIQFAPKL